MSPLSESSWDRVAQITASVYRNVLNLADGYQLKAGNASILCYGALLHEETL
jgi:hypothetical protein